MANPVDSTIWALKKGLFPLDPQHIFQPFGLVYAPDAQMGPRLQTGPPGPSSVWSLGLCVRARILQHGSPLCPWSETLNIVQSRDCSPQSPLLSLSPLSSLLQPFWPLHFLQRTVSLTSVLESLHIRTSLTENYLCIFFLANLYESVVFQLTYNFWCTRNNTYLCIDYLLHYSSWDFHQLRSTVGNGL